MMSLTHDTHEERSGMRFAHWVPNVSGGLVVSKVPQRTDWGLDYNIKLAQLAETAGFEYALTQVRFMGRYGAEYQHDSMIFSAAILAATKRLKIISAVLPGIFHPAVIAKQGATADQIFNGRWCVHVASGWNRVEYDALGIEWPEHDERYNRSREFIDIIRGSWTQDRFSYEGKYWQIRDFTLRPKPLALPDRLTPEIFQGGNSRAAQEMAAAVSDWYLMNGDARERLQVQIANVSTLAKRVNRTVNFGVNAFIIARETEGEALSELERIIGSADTEAVEDFSDGVKEAGQATADRVGMWTNSNLRDLVQYNDGFKTNLIGTPEQIALRIYELRKVGVGLVICGFLHFHEEVKFFGERVIPLVRELERSQGLPYVKAEGRSSAVSTRLPGSFTPGRLVSLTGTMDNRGRW